ncbi:uncharacterized protein F5891DRAFT_1184306 [Suillus fuscotomentosus]|uniref:Uncharacterized protein n=1 Tax=Suillus fuscotomentosus TaxID=1912939 RepID=A0AAD4EEQ6_9AGAM|nr:uncharacterized protein F5891DRAFT_1184306 [Suillus fuscotomentosus]KAG1904884.1 hypothetical protein F5891DRAFT_1184306 [Suillus fuscotomentosus]
MSSDCDTHTNDSHPSDFNDGADAILAYANFKFEGSRRSTPESHFGCPGSAHGQGAPVYSCGCYKYNILERFKPSPSPPDNEQAFQLADEFGAEQPKPQLEVQDGDHYNGDARHSKRKRSDDHDDVIPRNFGQDVRATSVPVVELQPPVKHRKIERKFELFEGESALAKVMQEVVEVREVVSRIEAVIDRQNTVLLEICNAIENHGM